MDMMSLPGFRALAQDRARSISHSARAASIRYATAFGSILAFVMLCVLSVRANAAPVVNEGAGAQYARGPRAVAALSARDALATRVQPEENPYSRDATGIACDSEVIPAAEAGLLQHQVAMGAHRAVMVWHGLLISLLALAALTLVALGGWCRARVALISLQKGQGEDEAIRPPAGQPLIPLGQGIQDFADTAAIVSQLDLTICVDTSVAHVAGALGKPCWVMLPSFNTDWRWLTDQTDSPWYPKGIRLFRQAKFDDWTGVIDEVTTALKSWAMTHPRAKSKAE
jgi:hypothetical protein